MYKTWLILDIKNRWNRYSVFAFVAAAVGTVDKVVAVASGRGTFVAGCGAADVVAVIYLEQGRTFQQMKQIPDHSSMIRGYRTIGNNLRTMQQWNRPRRSS